MKTLIAILMLLAVALAGCGGMGGQGVSIYVQQGGDDDTRRRIPIDGSRFE